MKNIIYCFFILIFLSSCEERTVNQEVISDRAELENGDATTPISFNDGITAEFATLQARYLNIVKFLEMNGELSQPECHALVDKLISECTRIEKVLQDMEVVGNGGEMFKTAALDHLNYAREFGNAALSEEYDGVYLALNSLELAETDFIEAQKTFASNNNFRLGEVVDPEKVE